MHARRLKIIYELKFSGVKKYIWIAANSKTGVDPQKDLPGERGFVAKDSHAYIRLKRRRATRDRGAGDTTLQVTRRATRPLKARADAEKSQVACRQSRDRELWDTSFSIFWNVSHGRHSQTILFTVFHPISFHSLTSLAFPRSAN